MSSASRVHHPDPCLYEDDFFTWTKTTAALLRQRRFAEVDIAHLAEELEDMGKRERRELESHLRNVTLHLLKWQYQSTRRETSWRQSIRNGRIEMQKFLRDSPSLAVHIPQILDREYSAARADAVDETELSEKIFPADCPFTPEQILDVEFWPA